MTSRQRDDKHPGAGRCVSVAGAVLDDEARGRQTPGVVSGRWLAPFLAFAFACGGMRASDDGLRSPAVEVHAAGPAPSDPTAGRAPSPVTEVEQDRDGVAAARPSSDPMMAARWDEVAIEGWRPAVVFVPPGPADRRFPLAVVMHGAGGRPEPHCENWRRLLRERAYLLCPRGTPWGHVPEGEEPVGYFFRDHRALGRELVLALAAVRAAHAPRLDAERALFVGFSQGATMGALALHELARTPEGAGAFGRLALVEGGTAEWNVALSRLVKDAGVTRALLVCGQRSCARSARDSEGWMRQGGLEVRFEDAPGAGHTWGGGVGERVVAALPWLLEGDPRF